MKKITLILILIAAFATQSFAYCPIPQWCPKADLHQVLCAGELIDPIEFPSVIAKILIVTWWTDETRIYSTPTPPPGITVSGASTPTPLGEREYAWPVSISGASTAIGTHHYTVSNTCGVELLHGSITVAGPPTIGMVTPTIDQTTWQNIPFDSTLTITDDPIGMTPITIQWYSSPTPSSAAGTGGTAVTGATGNTFAPPANIVNTDGIYYYAVATDRCGSTTATNNTGGKHIVVPLCNSYPGATGVASCTGSAGVAPGIVSWGGSTNIETHARDISGNKITQRWSDVVTTTGCEKTGFTPSNVAADCRNSTNGSGVHYFTWCYVMRYQAQLCPSPWRVPTCQDFINLDVAMGGTGELRDLTDNATSNGWTGTDANEKYTGTAAGTWGGARWTALDPLNGLPDVLSLYWSSSESSITIANDLFYAGIILNPVNIGTKGSGIALRCVRDVP